ncbi:D-2-hydroxyacid dehydrogenase [Metabacillus sp. GX 13764]|uniref:D-2-hydroxyacid dehydrogenase n=1 Tax=Metabacillus kandeliae TaxID=2900151 RepID=UPI001E2A64E5|nr:D-2-hydroxyacid dehydrogenase [Metabacillus kandeliae]MCD7034083.1 D-2-hydroxyacid dehydrogenase [Metabacillus kandeliae]
MGKRKLILAQNAEKQWVEKVQQALPDWEVIFGKEEEKWKDHIKDAEIIAGWKKAMEPYLQSDLQLKWVQAWSAGVNDMPLKELEKKGVTVTSANGVHAYPISETIFALMLGLTRKIQAYVKNQEKKEWHHSNLKLEIHNKTIGILGFGAIGKETAKIAKAFGMKVLGLRHSGKEDEFADAMYTPDSLNSMLPECDFVVVTLPLTEDTKHMIGKEQFGLMRESACFINIGRGDIVEENSLIQALQEGGIAGAGLDVFAKEPLPENSPLWEMENVIVTPHTAGSTEYYDQRVIEDIFLPNLKKYLEGEDPGINKVSFEKGY